MNTTCLSRLDRFRPVYCMHCDTRTAAGRLRHADHDWWFCSMACAGRCVADPELYSKPSA